MNLQNSSFAISLTLHLVLLLCWWNFDKSDKVVSPSYRVALNASYIGDSKRRESNNSPGETSKTEFQKSSPKTLQPKKAQSEVDNLEAPPATQVPIQVDKVDYSVTSKQEIKHQHLISTEQEFNKSFSRKEAPKSAPSRPQVSENVDSRQARRISLDEEPSIEVRSFDRYEEERSVEVVSDIGNSTSRESEKEITLIAADIRSSLALHAESIEQQDNNLKELYLAELKALISQMKRYPKRALRQRQEGIVWIEFMLSRDGVFENVGLSDSSGYSILDQAAISTIEQIEKFKPLPREFSSDFMILRLPIQFVIR